MALLPDKGHGEGGVAVHRGKIRQESGGGDIVVVPQPQALFRMDSISFAELLNGGKSCKVSPEDAQDKEQTVAGVRNDDIREDSVGVPAAVAEYPENA